MFRTGVDTIALEKEYTPLEAFANNFKETGEKKNNINDGTEVSTVNASVPQTIVAKALLGASVTTHDPDFDRKYKEAIKESLEKYGIRQTKQIYKAAHLLKQATAKFDDIFTEILNVMEPSIDHIDLYHATYHHDNPLEDYVSVFGKAQGQRLSPHEYIEKNRNGFDQACTWWHWRMHSKQEPDHQYCIDKFDSKMTPSWGQLESNMVSMKVYYSGCECNCLISFADLILKEIESYHFGPIDYMSIVQPIHRRAKTYWLGKKIKSYNLSMTDKIIRETVPDSPFDIHFTPYIKHPIYFIAWTPKNDLPRKTVKPAFEWSKFYNSIIKKALEMDGCVKFLDFDRDNNLWEECDFIVPWESEDLEHVRQLQAMGFDYMPKVLNATDLTT
jgi:hypothetical protein